MVFNGCPMTFICTNRRRTSERDRPRRKSAQCWFLTCVCSPADRSSRRGAFLTTIKRQRVESSFGLYLHLQVSRYYGQCRPCRFALKVLDKEIPTTNKKVHAGLRPWMAVGKDRQEPCGRKAGKFHARRKGVGGETCLRSL